MTPWNKGVKKSKPSKKEDEYEKSPKKCLYCLSDLPYKRHKKRKYRSDSCAHLDPKKKRSGGCVAGGNSGSFKKGEKPSENVIKAISGSMKGMKRVRACCIICKTEGAVSLLKRWHSKCGF